MPFLRSVLLTISLRVSYLSVPFRRRPPARMNTFALTFPSRFSPLHSVPLPPFSCHPSAPFPFFSLRFPFGSCTREAERLPSAAAATRMHFAIRSPRYCSAVILSFRSRRRPAVQRLKGFLLDSVPFPLSSIPFRTSSFPFRSVPFRSAVIPSFRFPQATCCSG